VTRSSWDEYFMRIAVEVSTRATCVRRAVGAVITSDRAIVATGYNGAVRGMPHCSEIGCLMVEGHCARAVHAEANAIAQAAREGAHVAGSSIYITAAPCWACFRLLVNSGIVRVVCRDEYTDHGGVDGMVEATAAQLGIQIIRGVGEVKS
jgi:dCMP deaminase